MPFQNNKNKLGVTKFAAMRTMRILYAGAAFACLLANRGCKYLSADVNEKVLCQRKKVI